MMEFISIDSIVTEYLELSAHSGPTDKSLYKKWADFLVSKMPYIDHYEQVIKFDFVKDYQCPKPKGFDTLIQLAFCPNKSVQVKRTQVVEWVQQIHDGSGCELVISMECPGCHKVECSCTSPEIVVDVDRLWELNHPEFKYGHLAWYYRHGGLGNDNVPVSPYHPEFKLIAPARNVMFDADNYIKGCLNLNKHCANTPEKFIISQDTIRFSEKEGRVIICYLAAPIDEDGYRKIPNVPELIEAITWFLEERVMYREYKKTRNPQFKKDSVDAMVQKERFMGIAREKLLTQDYQSFQRDLGAFYGRFLPSEDICGNVTDVYHEIMSRLNPK